MNDSDSLRDAFRGFEDQADQLTQARASTGEVATRSSDTTAPRRRVAVVAGAVVAVAAVVAGVALLVPGGTSHHGTAGGEHPAATLVTSNPASANSSPSGKATVSTPSTPAHSTPKVKPGPPVPGNRREMIAAFKRVLGTTATFTVTSSHGNFITGILTSAGHQGGFDVQANNGQPGDQAECEDAATSHCTVIATKNGGSLSTGHEPVGHDMLYLVNYVGPDGRSYLMHLSSNADPKTGGGTSFGSTPPLTIAQMATILESDRW